MRILKLFLFLTGILLLAINTAGLFKSLRNEDLYSEITPYRNDISISFPEAKKQWNRMENESEHDFAIRSTLLINHAMAHYWKEEGIRKYKMQIPVSENYILSLTQLISGAKKYELRNYKKIIERGVGICSQPCIALKDMLNEDGIKADLWDLRRHVVVEATFSDGTKYMLDPDYGKFVPFGMSEIQADPELVRESYKDQDLVYADHIIEHNRTDDIVKLYGGDENRIYYMNSTFEDMSYLAVWIFPLLLILPFALTISSKRNKN